MLLIKTTIKKQQNIYGVNEYGYYANIRDLLFLKFDSCVPYCERNRDLPICHLYNIPNIIWFNSHANKIVFSYNINYFLF